MPEPVERGNAEEVAPVDESAKVYDDAFSEAEAAGGKAELSPADDPANVSTGEPVAPIESSEEPVMPSSETPPKQPDAPPDSEQKPGETDAEYKQRWLTLQGIHKHDKEIWEQEKQTLLAQVAESRKPSDPTPAEPLAPQDAAAAAAALYDSLTDEQKEALKNYEQDFDVVSKMEGIKREVELKKLRLEIDEKLAALDARIKPVIQRTEEVENEAHFDAILNAHPDYKNYVNDGSLMSWIEKKPAYIQPALKAVYNQGAAEDAISLLDDFKRENNIQPPTTAEVVPINQKREQKRKALAGVDTRRSAVAAQVPIKDDYEGAFDEAAQKQG